MVRLVKWYPDQVASRWGLIGPMIELTLPPIASNSEERMTKVLEAILCGKLVIYAVYNQDEEGKPIFYGLLVVSVVEAIDGTERTLLIYSLYGAHKVTMKEVAEILSLIKKVAIAEDCQSLTAYTSVSHLVRLLKEDGWNTDFTFVRKECNMGGGGGSTGKTDFPDHMKNVHNTWLQEMLSKTTTAQAANPFTGLLSYNPDTTLALVINSANDFLTYVTTLSTAPGTAAAIAAFDVALTNQFNATSVARFEAGMRSIGAVQTSSFVIGKAMMLARKDEQVARYAAELNLSNINHVAELRRSAYILLMEGYKMSLIAKKEESESNIEYDVREATWQLDMYHYGSNMLGVLGSGGMGWNPTRPSKTQTAIGGALSGSASGAMAGSTVSPGYGTAIGAVIGAIIGGVGGYMAGS